MQTRNLVPLAVVGLGNFFSQTHAAALKKLQQEKLVEVRWLVDVVPDNLRKAARLFPKAACFASVDSLLKTVYPGAAIILVNEKAKPAIFGPFIERGIPFFTEKPPAETAVLLRRFLHRYKKLPYHLVAWNRRYAPAVNMLKEFIGRKKGRLSLLCADFLRYDQASPLPGVGNLQHVLDTMRYLGGEIRSLKCLKGNVSLPGEGRPFSFSGLIRFASGTMGQFNYNADAGIDRETYRAMATNEMAMAEMGFPADARKEYTEYHNRKSVQRTVIKGSPQYVNGIEGEYREFIRGLARNSRNSPTPLEDSLKTLAMCETAAMQLAAIQQ